MVQKIIAFLKLLIFALQLLGTVTGFCPNGGVAKVLSMGFFFLLYITLSSTSLQNFSFILIFSGFLQFSSTKCVLSQKNLCSHPATLGCLFRISSNIFRHIQHNSHVGSVYFLFHPIFHSYDVFSNARTSNFE